MTRKCWGASKLFGLLFLSQVRLQSSLSLSPLPRANASILAGNQSFALASRPLHILRDHISREEVVDSAPHPDGEEEGPPPDAERGHRDRATIGDEDTEDVDKTRDWMYAIGFGGSIGSCCCLFVYMYVIARPQDQEDKPTDSTAEPIETFEWEQDGEPFTLLISVCIEMIPKTIGLIVVYFSTYSRENLMNCDSRTEPFALACLCEYTKAYARAFPLFAACISLLVGLQSMLTQRLYYAMLKAEGLLDFKNVNALEDPLFFWVLFSFFHGVLHLTLKLLQETPYSTWQYIKRGSVEEAKFQSDVNQLCKGFIFPGAIFILFFFFAYQVENILVSLSRYFEEDPLGASQRASKFMFLKEGGVHYLLKHSDPIGNGRVRSTPELAKQILLEYPKAEKEWEEQLANKPHEGLRSRILHLMWPGKVLLDFRLRDMDSVSFRGAFTILLVFTLSFFIFTIFAWFQKGWEDLFHDAWELGQIEDALCGVAYFIHVFLILYAGYKTMSNLSRPKVTEGLRFCPANTEGHTPGD